jgi:two-component system sensor histidine kinase KdpD
MIPLDDILIEQVLVNLLENALRYTPAGSPIEVRAYRDESSAVVEVSDRGPGIGPADRKRIFDKFYRGESRRYAGGSGLGLAICQGIVKAHGGEIGVKDREGGGSIFFFSLPLEGSA